MPKRSFGLPDSVKESVFQISHRPSRKMVLFLYLSLCPVRPSIIMAFALAFSLNQSLINMHWFLSYYLARFLTILGPIPSVQSIIGFTSEQVGPLFWLLIWLMALLICLFG